MPNYKEMYMILLAEVESAIELLQDAQRKAEDIYILTDESEEEEEKAPHFVLPK